MFNRIGETTAEERNIISGNNGGGIGVGRGVHGNLVMGNFIGTDINGTSALGNAGDGISAGSNSGRFFIGGMTEGERNVISGNGGPGIHLPGSGTDYYWVAGNYIGTDASGTLAVGNKGDGISIYNGEHNIMQNNTIAYNTEAGVGVGSSAYNTIRRNSIHSHPGRGIVLSHGGNKALPAPVIASGTPAGISGTACPGCTVEVFSDAEDEGRVYEGSAIADGNGNWTWTGSLNGPYVTATATDEAGNTSVFSAPQMAWQHRVYLPLILRERIEAHVA